MFASFITMAIYKGKWMAKNLKIFNEFKEKLKNYYILTDVTIWRRGNKGRRYQNYYEKKYKLQPAINVMTQLV